MKNLWILIPNYSNVSIDMCYQIGFIYFTSDIGYVGFSLEISEFLTLDEIGPKKCL
jgi:hypothetical protein